MQAGLSIGFKDFEIGCHLSQGGGVGGEGDYFYKTFPGGRENRGGVGELRRQVEDVAFSGDAGFEKEAFAFG